MLLWRGAVAGRGAARQKVVDGLSCRLVPRSVSSPSPPPLIGLLCLYQINSYSSSSVSLFPSSSFHPPHCALKASNSEQSKHVFQPFTSPKLGYTAPLSAPISLVRFFSSPNSRFNLASTWSIWSPSSNSPLSSRRRIQSRRSSSVRTIPSQVGSCALFFDVGDEGLGLASGEVSGDEAKEVLEVSRILEMEILGRVGESFERLDERRDMAIVVESSEDSIPSSKPFSLGFGELSCANSSWGPCKGRPRRKLPPPYR